MTAKIAILGWGSLLWDAKPEFDRYLDTWQYDGPRLKLEFSRKSKTRNGALTLVIDNQHGCECAVAYCFSKRKSLDDAIADLRCREGTISNNIGFWSASGKNRGRDRIAVASIAKWACDNSIGSVVWTDLASNFEGFSIQQALSHVQGLEPIGKAKAAEYVWRAPDFIKTNLRAALEGAPWFAYEAAFRTDEYRQIANPPSPPATF